MIKLKGRNFTLNPTYKNALLGLRLNFKATRENKGLSYGDLAKITGINRKTIENIEGGEINPSVETLVKLVSAMDSRLVIASNEEVEKSSHKKKTTWERLEEEYQRKYGGNHREEEGLEIIDPLKNR